MGFRVMFIGSGKQALTLNLSRTLSKMAKSHILQKEGTGEIQENTILKHSERLINLWQFCTLTIHPG